MDEWREARELILRWLAQPRARSRFANGGARVSVRERTSEDGSLVLYEE